MRRAGAALSTFLVAAFGPATEAAAPAPDVPRFRAGSAPEGPALPTGRHLTARLNRPTLLRAEPGGRVIARLTARTEFGSPRVLAVTAQRRGWLEVIATALPNGERGWVRAASARVRGTNFALVVDRSARRAELRHGNRVLRRIKVAVGQPGNETPLGTFAVTDKLTPNADTSPYGCCIVALSGHQPRLPASWGGGDRLAFHGTTEPGSIGGRTSLGCLRASARDMRALLDRVPLGAPVIIRA